MELLTFGHGTLRQDDIVELVKHAGIARVLDVRTVPKSRTHPWVWREQMEQWLPSRSGASYAWEPRLGGFRKPQISSHNTGLRNPSFRGYADYMETDAFLQTLGALTASLATIRTAVMCSETLWWRCHRRLIADAAVLLHGVDVYHVMPGGGRSKHSPTPGVRRTGHVLRYDDAAA